MKINLDETELARLEALAGKASKMPFFPDGFDVQDDFDQIVCRCNGVNDLAEDVQEANAHYIAAACNAVPALVAEVRRLRAELDAYIDEDQTKVITFQRKIMDVLHDKLEAWEWYDECRRCVEWLDETYCSNDTFSEAESTYLAAREAVHADRE